MNNLNVFSNHMCKIVRLPLKYCDFSIQQRQVAGMMCIKLNRPKINTKNKFIDMSIHLISFHDSAANTSVVPQHAGVIEVKTVLREKLAVIERERTVAPKMHVRHSF